MVLEELLWTGFIDLKFLKKKTIVVLELLNPEVEKDVDSVEKNGEIKLQTNGSTLSRTRRFHSSFLLPELLVSFSRSFYIRSWTSTLKIISTGG